jgi:lipoprotein-anchoring transpeptidase ErfK/SrfK
MSALRESRVPAEGRYATRLGTLASLALLSLAIAGCNAHDSSASQHPRHSTAAHSEVSSSAPQRPSVAHLSANVRSGSGDVTVDTPVTVRVADGTLADVVFRMHSHSARLPGAFNASHTTWRAKNLLEPGVRYVVRGRAEDADGRFTTRRIAFRTEPLTLAEQTYARIAPLQNETVGVGMPVIVQFDVPVSNRAKFERHMHVRATPATAGSWSWLSDNEVHWRPKTYWKPGTTVHVDLDINGLAAGNGVYGQMDRSADFTVGQSVVMRADLRTDRMKVLLNGKLARTIPITGGKPGLETRSGTKLIVEKFLSKRMDAATVGVSPSSPDYYNIPNVQYAQRVTFSGEFLHAAPWSVYAQGNTNVSHGCVGMSTSNARWLFHLTHRGDPVEVTGSSRGLEPGNGWTDWNESFAAFKKGSAL